MVLEDAGFLIRNGAFLAKSSHYFSSACCARVVVIAHEPVWCLCSARISGDRQTHTHKHTHTDTENDYRNPRCACAPGVNNIYGSRYLSFMVITLLMKILSIICHVPSSIFPYSLVVTVLFAPILVCSSIIKIIIIMAHSVRLLVYYPPLTPKHGATAYVCH